MKISVIIPVYNEEKYIEKCLESLLNQERKIDEIIVVDNNCTDKTIEIVRKYKNKLPLKIIKEKKQGIGYSRTAGFNKAKYDILTKCDADTILPQDWSKKIEKVFLEKKEIVAVSMPLLSHDLLIADKSTFPFYFYMFIPRLIMGFYPTITCYAVKKSAWDKIKNYVCLDDKKAHEDIDISFHIKKFGNIFHDKTNTVFTSARRIKYKPWSFFVEYTLIFFNMLKNH